MRLITTALINSSVDVICCCWETCPPSSASLLLSLSFRMTMTTSLLCMKQWAAWSHHLQLLQHFLKCSDIQWHFKKSVILHFWQSVQLSEINTSLLWIRIAFMYNDWWDKICCLKICLCMKRTSQSEKTKITIIWKEWMKMHSCCTSTERTEFASFAVAMRACWYRMRVLHAVRSEKQICITLT